MKNLEGARVVAARSVMVATPDEKLRAFVERSFEQRNFEVEIVGGGAKALSRLEADGCEILLLDRVLPDLDAGELKRLIAERYPRVRSWIVRFESGRFGIEIGCDDVPLPPEISLLLDGLEKQQALWSDGFDPEPVDYLDLDFAAEPEYLPGVVGRSAAIRRVQELVRLVVSRTTAVLLTGETGTGKELVAQAIHQLGPRASRPFIAVNCAAIPESLFESELFGYHRGAFTGAVESRVGRVNAAHTGTLFLDEVGQLSLAMQAKMLRFLQEGEIQRLGSHDRCRVDVRVLAATNVDLEVLVSKGLLREDLYYRLSVFPIELAPLRERPEDIGPLVQHFLRRFSAESGLPPKLMSPAALRCLISHPWRGNIRELKHATERAFILSDRSPVVLPEHFGVNDRKAAARYPIEEPQRNLIFSL